MMQDTLDRVGRNKWALTSPAFVHGLTKGNVFFDHEGREIRVETTAREYAFGRYVGDIINGEWYKANEVVQLVVGASTGGGGLGGS